jgi:DNA-binding NarL/FixJ family response regulator
MSRAILKMLLARTIKHEPSHTELTEFLAHCRDLGGARIYVPQHDPSPDEVVKILELRAVGLSIRRIAKELSVSKSQVHRALSQIPVGIVDSQ